MCCAVKEEMIAPCGMNCTLCSAFQREKNHCAGCRNEKDILYKAGGSSSCVIKNCINLSKSPFGFCFDCGSFPCRRLLQLDKRYRGKYHMSMLDNLAYIRNEGLQEFLLQQEARFACRVCGSTVCVHKHMCLSCKAPLGDIEQDPDNSLV